MIPSQNIVAWANVVPWAEPRQVEQDLIISRSLVEMFSDRRINSKLQRHEPPTSSARFMRLHGVS